MKKVREKQARTIQQAEALKYFHTQAQDWEDKAAGQIKYKVNVIKQRNEYVLHVISQREKTKWLLDVGSGVGDLVCAVAKLGIKATGIDIAGGMVDLAHRRAADEKLGLAEFILTDYFDWHVPAASYDVVVANGFIEYVSYEQRDEFFSDAYRILKPNGSLIVSARNRLYNVLSANEYTRDEITSGTLDKLVGEIWQLVNGQRLADLLRLETAPWQPEEMKHVRTGIGVATRYQYTPVQLMKLLDREGFAVQDVTPIHVHVGAADFKREQAQAHYAVANYIQPYALNNLQLIGSASAFMIHGVKA